MFGCFAVQQSYQDGSCGGDKQYITSSIKLTPSCEPDQGLTDSEDGDGDDVLLGRCSLDAGVMKLDNGGRQGLGSLEGASDGREHAIVQLHPTGAADLSSSADISQAQCNLLLRIISRSLYTRSTDTDELLLLLLPRLHPSKSGVVYVPTFPCVPFPFPPFP